jgi:hypothetical protein
MHRHAREERENQPSPDLPSSPLTPVPSDITPIERTVPKRIYHDSSSDSSSDNTHIPQSQHRKMTKYAPVDQPAQNKPPKLQPGELTPEVARDWDNACTTYFMHKGIAAEDQVKMVAFGMQDPRLHTWYLAQRAVLDAGTFAEYMTALKNAWLDTHCDTKLRRKVLGSQQGNRGFFEWALELQNQNTLLYGNAVKGQQFCWDAEQCWVNAA